MRFTASEGRALKERRKSWAICVSSATISGNYARTCPHCFKAIEKQTWDKQIIPAFLAMSDANRELVKDSSGYHTPLFEVSYEADSVFRNGYENCPNLD